MQLSVVIPTYNRCALLARTLPTIFEQTCSPDAYEVIVVIDGSADGTVEMLHQFHPSCSFQVLEQPNHGQAAARNAGIRAASGDLVLFLDDDLLCEPNLIAEHLAAHQSGEDLVVSGVVDVSPESPSTLAARRMRVEARDLNERLCQEELSLPLDAVVGANASLRRSTLLDLGGFDERYFRALEDAELGLRLWFAGVRFRFRASAITHQVYVKSNWGYTKGDGATLGRAAVWFARQYPVMRKTPELARYSEGRVFKIWARQVAVRMPALFSLLTIPPCWFAEHLPRVKFFERIGLRMMAARRTGAMLQSAVAEAGGWQSFKAEFGVLLPVLLYHRVGMFRRGTDSALTISPEKFERQIRWLSRHGYVGIRPSDWLNWCRGAKALPKKSIMLTFDDAYADVAQYALPILKKYGFSATVFVVTDRVGGTNAWDEKKGSTTLRCMTAEQIRQWAAEGIEFGAHSCTHPDLRTLSEAELAEEMRGSAQYLSNLLGKRVQSFAYPFGSYSMAAKKLAEETFDLAFTCDGGLNALYTDPFLMHRTMVFPDDTLADLAFWAKLGSSPFRPMRYLREWLWKSRDHAPERSVGSTSSENYESGLDNGCVHKS